MRYQIVSLVRTQARLSTSYTQYSQFLSSTPLLPRNDSSLLRQYANEACSIKHLGNLLAVPHTHLRLSVCYSRCEATLFWVDFEAPSKIHWAISPIEIELPYSENFFIDSRVIPFSLGTNYFAH